MKRLLSILLVHILFFVSAAAQTSTRPTSDYNFSPQAYNMTISGQVQPDLNSGRLSLTIPIYTWKDPDFQLPVSLSYSTSGFKPNSPIGMVGLGWTMNIGGMISRQIVGRDDLTSSIGYKQNIVQYEASDMYELNLDQMPVNDIVTYKGYETTADVFHFSFGNHSGSFILNENGEFVVYGTGGESGTYKIDYSESRFTIETSDGYIYSFGRTPTARELLFNTDPVYYTLPGNNNEYVRSTSIIAWHLDRIVAPNGRILDFTYVSNRSNLVIPQETGNSPEEFATDDVSTSFSQGNYKIGQTNVYKYASMTTLSYLESISLMQNINSAPISIIELDYSYRPVKEVDSDDTEQYKCLVARQRKLDRVRFNDHNGNQLYMAELDYIFQNSRMLLNAVNISNVGRYDMEYNLSIGGHMPGLISNAIDFWGFYNGVHSNTDNDYSPMGIDMNYNEYIEDSYKNPNHEYSKTGTLKKLKYPTGGFTEFEYEANTAQYILTRRRNGSYAAPYSFPEYERDSIPTLIGPITFQDCFLPSPGYYEAIIGLEECGGVRIKRISEHDGHKYVFRKTYTYNRPGTNESSGMVMEFNRYYGGQYYLGQPYFNPIMKFSDYNLSKSHVSYSYVTEHYPDGSYVVNRFTDYYDHPDEFSPYKAEYQTTLDNPYVQDIAAYKEFLNNINREPDSRHYRRGLLKSQEWYSGTGSLQRKKEYTYQDSSPSYVSYLLTSGINIWSARRFLADYRLTQLKDIKYDGGEITTIQSYEYNGAGQVRKTSVTDSQGINGKSVYYRYLHENSSFDHDHMSAAVSDILTTSIRNGSEYVIGNERYEYDSSTKNMSPVRIIRYEILTPEFRSPTVSFSDQFNIGRNSSTHITDYSYNGLYRLTRESYPGNAYIEYEWDENGNHIIGKEINDSDQSEHFTWKDMVGLTRHVFPTTQSENYDYDDKHRLKSITDSNGSYLMKYDYYLENE